ncbi:hypothetical protein KDA08_03630 [Candidatus Saccharibacteria bacterium]|nr:hypothetical protein [Candidatus Saccharibacteria bacterium]
MKRSPLGINKSRETRMRKHVNHLANMANRAQLHSQKSVADVGKKVEIQLAIDAISKRM